MHCLEDDLDLAGRDPALPGLATLLHPAAFATAVQPFLPKDSAGTVRATYVRYKPGMNCLVAYEFESAGLTIPLYATAYRPEDHVKLHKAVTRLEATPESRSGGFVLPDEHVVVSIFPNDRRLPALRSLVDSSRGRRLLQRVFVDRPDLWRGSLTPLHYKPQRRCVTRLDVDGHPSTAIKFFGSSGYQAAHRAARAFVSANTLRTPCVIGRSGRHRLLAFEWLPGELLSEAIVDGAIESGQMALVGTALAELHEQRPQCLPRLSRELEISRLGTVADSVGFVCPSVARRAASLLARFTAELGNINSLAVPIHGDFYAKQVLLQDERVAVFDFDGAAIGDPAADFGNFLAHLERDVLRGRLDESRVALTREDLLRGYHRAGRLPGDGRIDLYTAIGLFALAPHPFRFREPGWVRRTEALLERTEAILDRAIRRTSRASFRQPKVEDDFGITGDPGLPFVGPALETTVVENQFRALPRLAGPGGSVSVQRIRVLRHKAGRRCLIQYDLSLPRGDRSHEFATILGKIRARGLDISTYRLSDTLWKAGFDAESSDGISIPEPVGCIPSLNMWLQRSVPGVPCTDLLLGANGVFVARRAAEALHKLHRSGSPPQRHHTMADELRILRQKLPLVAPTRPGLSRRLGRIVEACDAIGASVPETQPCPIHRDLHPDNLIVDGNRVYLLDLDLYCLGDPALDAGNFIAHVIEFGIRRARDPEAYAGPCEAFENAFLGLAGTDMRRTVQTYTTLTLARHIYLSTLFEARRVTTEPLVQLCERRLELGRKVAVA